MPALCRAWMGLADCTSERRWTSQQLPRFHNSHMLLQLVNHSLRHTIPVLPATAALARPTRLFSSEAATATTHYEVLGVERSAAPAVIKKAFRQKAKALHPDLNSHVGQSDVEAFLRLVAAYDVLSNAEQRRLYDAATDPQLPGMIRRAAAAQQQQAGAADASGPSTQHDADASLNWRWGMADWARYGPASSPDVPMSASEGSRGSGGPLGLRLSVLSALRRHQRDLEVELHAALMTAFLGPRLELKSGELPTSFELDERSHPSLTDDLLHLVHGRTLLGVVQLPHTLRLEGGGDSPLRLPHSSSSTSSRALQPTQRILESGGTSLSTQSSGSQSPNAQQPPQTHTHGTATHCNSQQHTSQQQQAQQGLHPAGSQQQQQDAGAGGAHAAAGTAAAGQQQMSAEAQAAARAADPDAEITDNEWRELLQKQHPLLGAYDWRTDPATAASSSDAAAEADRQQDQGQGEHVVDGVPVERLTMGAGEGEVDGLPQRNTGDSQQQQQQPLRDVGCDPDPAAAAAVSEGGFGGRAARVAWEQKNEGLVEAADAVGQLRPPVDMPRLSEEDVAFIAQYEHSMGPDSSQPRQEQQQQQQRRGRSWQQQWNQLDPAGQVQMQQQWHQQWQEQQEQRQQEKQQWEDMQQLEQQLLQQQHEQQGHHQHQQQQQDQQAPHGQQQQQQARRRPRSGHRRLWRWLRTPSADWHAADWSFSDESEGVLVLRLLQEGAVAAVGVRDESQPNKPIKVYVDGVLYAALLEDVVMQPLTGKLMAVLYRFYTPGVHHCYFYLPNTPGASRVLAKMLRRWMPPSATWLFPPRTDSHDRCSWVLEWEGFGTQHRPGWLHPAVYVLTSAYYSYDIEARRLSGTSGALQEWWSRAAWAVTRAWSACRELGQRLELIVGR